jgi:hypothetical protein
MLYKSLLMLHVSSAAIGLMAGFMAMAFRKGSGLHGAAGTIFFVSMLGMGGAGATIAGFIRPNAGNLTGGLLIIYLVSTAWIAAKRTDWKIGVIDFGSLVFALTIATAHTTFGIQAVLSPTGLKDGYPPPLYFIFGTIAMLFVASDFRLILRGGVAGVQRIKRHLWRMSLALLFATASFYPGQARLFPKWLRATSLLYIPHILLIGAMFFFLYRYSVRKRAQRNFVAVIGNLEAQPQGAAR